MAQRKDRHALISRFEKLAKGKSQVINRYVEEWAADSLLESMPKDNIYEAMDYYFEINNSNPQWRAFVRNADKILTAKRDRERDEIERAERRRQMKEVLNEFGG